MANEIRHVLTEKERIAMLERDMAAILGNGQPGRLTRVEQKIDDLKWWIIGSVLLGTSGGTAVSHWLSLLK